MALTDDQLHEITSELLSRQYQLNRLFIINDEIDEAVCDVFFLQMLELFSSSETPPEEIKLFVSSYGGGVQAGLTIMDLVATCPIPVTAITYSQLGSIALDIYLAADNRLATSSTEFIFHSLGFEASYDKIKEQSSLIDRMTIVHRKRAEWFAHRTNKHRTSYWMKLFEGPDLYFDLPEAIKLGIVHREATYEDFK